MRKWTSGLTVVPNPVRHITKSSVSTTGAVVGLKLLLSWPQSWSLRTGDHLNGAVIWSIHVRPMAPRSVVEAASGENSEGSHI